MANPHYGEFKFSKPTARPTSKGYAKGGQTKGQAKVAKVMTEFKAGDLHSGSKKGPVVKNPKQAMAIALSEKKAAGYKKGGETKKEPTRIVKQEIALLKKADAPAKLIKHEQQELRGYKEGGKTGLWDNIHAKRERIKEGSGERMRKPGSKGAPTAQDFKAAAGKGYKEGGEVTPKSMMKDRARAKEVVPPQQQRQPAASMANAERAGMRPQPAQTTGATMTDRERRMLEAAREEKMDRQMRQAESERGVHNRMLDEAMNPLSIMKDIYNRATDRSGQSAEENMKRYGMKEGGSAKHEDVAMDKKMIKKAVHKHETAMHPDEPLTKLQTGGNAAQQQRMQMMQRQQQQMRDQYRDMDSGSLFRPGNVRSYRPAPVQAQTPAKSATPAKPVPKPIVNTSGLGFKKGGTTKKGVPVHKRNAKIC